jgi:acetyl-CoA carboxylase biotin carboxylase subunit
MIGKLIVHRPTRAEAIKTMLRALDEFVIEGVKTTIPLAKRMFRDPNFVAGNVHTKYVEQTLLAK